jgi:hypothetical protein
MHVTCNRKPNEVTRCKVTRIALWGWPTGVRARSLRNSVRLWAAARKGVSSV